MNSTPNILTERERCALECRYGPEYPHIGDVRRCVHGRIWQCLGTKGYGHWGDWDRLIRVVWSPWYWRARRALAATKESAR